MHSLTTGKAHVHAHLHVQSWCMLGRAHALTRSHAHTRMHPQLLHPQPQPQTSRTREHDGQPHLHHQLHSSVAGDGDRALNHRRQDLLCAWKPAKGVEVSARARWPHRRGWRLPTMPPCAHVRTLWSAILQQGATGVRGCTQRARGGEPRALPLTSAAKTTQTTRHTSLYKVWGAPARCASQPRHHQKQQHTRKAAGKYSARTPTCTPRSTARGTTRFRPRRSDSAASDGAMTTYLRNSAMAAVCCRQADTWCCCCWLQLVYCAHACTRVVAKCPLKSKQREGGGTKHSF